MEKNVRRFFHKDAIDVEAGMDFDAGQKAAARSYASGKEYREAVKEVYRASEKKRGK